MTAFKTHIASDQGFSLVELITVTMLLGVIVGGAYMALGMVQNVTDGMLARDEAYQAGQRAVERMQKEIREAHTVATPGGDTKRLNPDAPPTATRLSFFADIDHNGYLDRVTYQLSAGQLTRKTATTTKLNPRYTDFGADSAPEIITDRVDPALTTLFVLKNLAGNTTTTYDDGNVDVSMVQITMKTVARSGRQTATVEFPVSLVMIRAFAPGISL